MVETMTVSTVVFMSLFFGGFAGLPIATPPLPADPVLERAAPDSCLFYFSSAGLAKPDAESKNLTEQMLANQEVSEFLSQVIVPLTRLAQQPGMAPPETTEAIMALIEVALTRPLAVSVDEFALASLDAPPEVQASLVVRAGDRNDAIETAIALLTAQALADIEAAEGVKIDGGTLQQIPTPFGPLSWGTVTPRGDEATYVATIGDRAIESLMKRLADTERPKPEWKTRLEKQMPVDRRSTFVTFHAAEAMRILRNVPAPDKDRFLAFLDASGIADLESVSATTGMSDEGVSSQLWLGFKDTPRGLFAAPAKAITSKHLARIPGNAVMAQSWSLDLSKFLESILQIVETVEPENAEDMRKGLATFRAAAGFDIDTHLLKTLGPDWTILSVPTPGGLMPGVAVIAGIRDRPTFATIHKVLVNMLQAATANAEVQVSVRQIPYRDHTLFCLEATGDKFAMPVTPTWCLTDDSLMVTISPQFMKTLLSRGPSDPGIGGLPTVTKAVGGSAPVLVGVTEPTWIVGSLCGLYELATPVARALLREKGIEFDLPQLPAASAIMPFVRPSVTVIRHEPGGIMVESTGTMPFGPFTAGGGMIGLSPASTPVLVAILLPAISAARDAANRSGTMNNVKQITIAMVMAAQEDDGERFPAQAICDKEGKPLLSWRVAILPYLGHQDLYEEFHLDEPWDSEHNRKLVGRIPTVYVTPGGPAEHQRAGLTTMQVIAGPGTVFAQPAQGMALKDVKDGMSYTLLVVEALPDGAVPWTKPEDVAFDTEEPLAGVGNPQRQKGLFVAGFLDGHVQALTPDLDPEVFKAMVTPAGGEVVELP
jgi:hypothetical protein